MKRSEMVCGNCINSKESAVGAKPGEILCKIDPVVRGKQPNDWCGRGEWVDSDGKMRYWGQWSAVKEAHPQPDLPYPGDFYRIDDDIAQVVCVFDSNPSLSPLDLSNTIVVNLVDKNVTVILPWDVWFSKLNLRTITKSLT
jgi:hypothetical protein